jgi:hypothetical protein
MNTKQQQKNVTQKKMKDGQHGHHQKRRVTSSCFIRNLPCTSTINIQLSKLI